ncbi:MAG: hypothetical protein BWX80_02332 [Candidatus Hydrogenedentes bacterium ADurb.Bin101]|nr:MAG: hypothetical protein BWX80_02332 [Candidatus Hydrogenedentes bacterium ADurb.Bin101]
MAGRALLRNRRTHTAKSKGANVIWAPVILVFANSCPDTVFTVSNKAASGYFSRRAFTKMRATITSPTLHP